ncbi:hypothetical protein ZIOFF_036736 [Zingiber officinale]|uniref:Uncharacterized protein n=1 Tax=Zingiber officinale TaxID=94328 RepID=A0A8J5GNG6_ZINOF|nr:hypothetical protein ZIOFF_036736 [Zingiber officinale]
MGEHEGRAISAFITIILILLTYSITYDIIGGIATYIVLRLCEYICSVLIKSFHLLRNSFALLPCSINVDAEACPGWSMLELEVQKPTADIETEAAAGMLSRAEVDENPVVLEMADEKTLRQNTM